MIGPGKGPLQRDMSNWQADDDNILYLWCELGTSTEAIEKIAIALSNALFADGVVFSLVELVPHGGGVSVHGICDVDGLINASVEKRIRAHFATILKERKNS